MRSQPVTVSNLLPEGFSTRLRDVALDELAQRGLPRDVRRIKVLEGGRVELDLAPPRQSPVRTPR